MFGSLTVKQEGGGAFLQCGDGGVEGLGSEHDAQRRVLDVDGGDDGGGHAGGVAGCLGGVGVEQLLEGAGGRAGVVGKCIGDLGAAVTEFGSGAAGLDDGDADTERGNSAEKVQRSLRTCAKHLFGGPRGGDERYG